MQQDDWLAAAEHGVPDLDAVHGRKTGPLGLRQRRRGRQRQPLRIGARGSRAREERQQAQEKRAAARWVRDQGVGWAPPA